MKKRYILISILIIIFTIFLLIFNIKKDKPRTTTVKVGNIKRTIEETGTIYSKRVNTFYSDMSRKVKILNASVGSKVKKGEVILVYENNYDLEIERANKQIEAITASYNETIKGADFQEISNIKLNISTIETNLDFSKNNLAKVKTLYENNALSQVEYDEAKNNVATLENKLKEANNNYDMMIQGVSSNVKKQYEAQIDEVMIQIKILEKNIEQSSIIAEFDGIITELNVHQGGMTAAGIPVVEIQDDLNLGVYVEVIAEDAAEIVKEMAFNILKDSNVEKSLSVKRIYPKAVEKVSDLGVEQKRVRIEADLDSLDSLDSLNSTEFNLGTEVDVEIVLQEKENVLLLLKMLFTKKIIKSM